MRSGRTRIGGYQWLRPAAKIVRSPTHRAALSRDGGAVLVPAQCRPCAGRQRAGCVPRRDLAIRHSHARRETPTYSVALRHYAVVLAPSLTYMMMMTALPILHWLSQLSAWLRSRDVVPSSIAGVHWRQPWIVTSIFSFFTKLLASIDKYATCASVHE
jgi:hypothetical protein